MEYWLEHDDIWVQVCGTRQELTTLQHARLRHLQSYVPVVLAVPQLPGDEPAPEPDPLEEAFEFDELELK